MASIGCSEAEVFRLTGDGLPPLFVKSEIHPRAMKPRRIAIGGTTAGDNRIEASKDKDREAA